MANQSQKKNQQSIRPIINILTYTLYGLIAWFLLFHSYFLLYEQISIWKMIITLGVSYSSHFSFKKMVYCWENQLPTGSADYFIDVLILNGFVQLFSVFTNYAWYFYLAMPLFVLWLLVKWVWDKLTPKYVQQEPEEEGKKQKKEKKQKIKYLKR